MRGLIEKAVAVLGGIGLLLEMSMMPASAAGQVPFHAHVKTVPTLSSVPYLLTGSGAGNVLGPFTQSGSIQPLGPPNSGCAGGFSVEHHDTYTVANGDTLNVTIHSDACRKAPGIYTGVLATFVVDGGTGRFNGATGGGDLHGLGNFNIPLINYDLDGTISIPGN